MKRLLLLLSFLAVTLTDNENQVVKWQRKGDVLTNDDFEYPVTQRLGRRGGGKVRGAEFWDKLRKTRGCFKVKDSDVPTAPLKPDPNWKKTHGTVRVAVKGSDGSHYYVYGFIDSGAAYSVIHPDVVKELRLPIIRRQSNIYSAIGTELENQGTAIVEFRSFDKTLSFKSYSVIQDLKMSTPFAPVSAAIQSKWKNLEPKADPSYFESKRIDFQIGADVAPLIWMEGKKGARNPQEGITAMNSVFGWIFMGNQKDPPISDKK